MLYEEMMVPRAAGERYLTQRNFRLLVAALIFAGVAGLFLYGTRSLRAPTLVVSAPEKDAATSQNIIDVRGRTDPDADVMVNGRPLYIGSDGAFEERLYLVKGVNALSFEAKNRYGKTTSLTRYLVVR